MVDRHFFEEHCATVPRYKPALLEEIRIQKISLAKRLKERSEDLMQKVCNESCDILSKMEVTSCTDCQTFYLSCNDPTLCTARVMRSYKWVVILVTVLMLLAVAGIGGYFFWLQKKAAEADEVLGNALLSGANKVLRPAGSAVCRNMEAGVQDTDEQNSSSLLFSPEWPCRATSLSALHTDLIRPAQ
nr:testis-expressed protein 51 isoform X3 [Rattus norvegicus]